MTRTPRTLGAKNCFKASCKSSTKSRQLNFKILSSLIFSVYKNYINLQPKLKIDGLIKKKEKKEEEEEIGGNRWDFGDI